ATCENAINNIETKTGSRITPRNNLATLFILRPC
ncbi:MAG: hypothetical protein ACI9U1_002008, partial [Porticoccaceae bacterium]